MEIATLSTVSVIGPKVRNYHLLPQKSSEKGRLARCFLSKGERVGEQKVGGTILKDLPGLLVEDLRILQSLMKVLHP